jgi:hypothetical protein
LFLFLKSAYSPALDPPLSAFGLRLPKDVYEPPPYFPRTIPDFRTWISSYFNQPDQWNGSLAELDSREVTERCTISFWSQEYEEKCIETTGLGSDDPVMYVSLLLTCLPLVDSFAVVAMKVFNARSVT